MVFCWVNVNHWGVLFFYIIRHNRNEGMFYEKFGLFNFPRKNVKE